MTGRPLTRAMNADGATPVLVCVPPAGIGPSIFRPWLGPLGRVAHLLAIDLDGHPADRWSAGASPPKQLATEVDGYEERPVTVFGHSAGCWLALALALRLAVRGRRPMTAILAAPPAEGRLWSWAARPDEALITDLVALGHLDGRAVADPRLAAAAVAAVRRDVAVARASARDVARRVAGHAGDLLEDVDLEVWWGRDDPAAGPGDLERVCGVPVARRTALPGGHFFPFEPGSPATTLLARRLTAVSAPSRPPPGAMRTGGERTSPWASVG